MTDNTNTTFAEAVKLEAETYAEKHGFRVPYNGTDDFYDETDVKASREGFLAGANSQSVSLRIEREKIEFAKWTHMNGWTWFELYNGWKHFKSAHENGVYKSDAELVSLYLESLNKKP